MILYETNSTWMMFIHHLAANMATLQKLLAHEFEPRVCNFR